MLFLVHDKKYFVYLTINIRIKQLKHSKFEERDITSRNSAAVIIL